MAETDADRFRRRLAAAGATIPDEIVDILVVLAAPLISAQEHLTEIDLGDAEPFCPSRRLPDDAT